LHHPGEGGVGVALPRSGHALDRRVEPPQRGLHLVRRVHRPPRGCAHHLDVGGQCHVPAPPLFLDGAAGAAPSGPSRPDVRPAHGPAPCPGGPSSLPRARYPSPSSSARCCRATCCAAAENASTTLSPTSVPRIPPAPRRSRSATGVPSPSTLASTTPSALRPVPAQLRIASLHARTRSSALRARRTASSESPAPPAMPPSPAVTPCPATIP